MSAYLPIGNYAHQLVIGHPVLVLQLTAADPTVALDDAQVTKIKYLLLEFIPAVRCHVDPGPGVTVTVPDHGSDELAPGIRAHIEATIGCAVRVEDLPD